MPDHPCCRVVTTEAVLAANRPALVAMLEAFLLAEDKYRQDPESAMVANMHLQNMSETTARQTALEPHSKLFVDPNSNAVVAMFEYMKGIDYLEKDVTLDPHSMIDTSLYLEALKNVGKSSPNSYWAELDKRFADWNS
jgi:ABC-type nitrate/sulfonate/bicarbonate transport system substrate-binding protein